MDRSAFNPPVAGGYSPVGGWADPEPMRAMERFLELLRNPIPAVLDTSCVRTGLDFQLRQGRPPASLTTVEDGTTRLFMERETLEETWRKLPEFADQLHVPVADLRRMFVEHWLPRIRVVALPPALRQLDERAGAVRDLDPDDYPAAALAALLSPCILLTHNYRHFRPLGIRDPAQGINAICAAIDIEVCERQFQAVVVVPAAPVVLIGAGAKWASDRIGPVAWFILAAIIVGGYLIFRRQTVERRQAIMKTAGQVGNFVLEESSKAASAVQQGCQLLGSYVVPPRSGGHRRRPCSVSWRWLRSRCLLRNSARPWIIQYDLPSPRSGPSCMPTRKSRSGKPVVGASSWGTVTESDPRLQTDYFARRGELNE